MRRLIRAVSSRSTLFAFFYFLTTLFAILFSMFCQRDIPYLDNGHIQFYRRKNPFQKLRLNSGVKASSVPWEGCISWLWPFIGIPNFLSMLTCQVRINKFWGEGIFESKQRANWWQQNAFKSKKKCWNHVDIDTFPANIRLFSKAFLDGIKHNLSLYVVQEYIKRKTKRRKNKRIQSRTEYALLTPSVCARITLSSHLLSTKRTYRSSSIFSG